MTGERIPWTPSMVKVLKRRWRDGESSGKIAKALGVSRNAVQGKLHRLMLAGMQGVGKRPPRSVPYAGTVRGGREKGKLANVDRDMFAKLWALGTPSPKIAEVLGCSVKAVCALAQRLGLPPRVNAKPRKILAPTDLFTRMWAAGVCSSAMAQHFGYAHTASISSRRIQLGLPARGHSLLGKTITVEQFFEMELGRRMADQHRSATND